MEITGNDAADGGGIYYNTELVPTVTNSTISNNTAQFFGGGINCSSSSPIFNLCTISGNSAGEDGGGVEAYPLSNPSFINCTIAGNTATKYGGGIDCWDSSSATLTNCTLSGNTAGLDGGGINCAASSLVVLNTILWGDTAANVVSEIAIDGASTFTITHSDIDGGWGTVQEMAANNNIMLDPLFINPATGDYHLQLGSSCIDAGTAAGAPADDIDGESRPKGLNHDMGVDEFNCFDMDIDGFYSGAFCGTQADCDDNAFAINPAATEICDGLDNDCNEQTDEGMTAPDNDLQAGICAGSKKSCNGNAGWVNNYSGVNNYEAGNEASCDNIDNDCDGLTDEGVMNTYQKDKDGDGYGSMLEADRVEACQPSPGEVVDRSDCDDSNPWRNPGLPELCGDGLDNDCGGDGDEVCIADCTPGEERPCNTGGKGVCVTGTETCEDDGQTIGWSTCVQDVAADSEICSNGLDDNCNGTIDDGCDTEFAALVDVTVNPIMVCFQASQALNADPTFSLQQGNGTLGGFINPCPASEDPIYCKYYTQGNVVEPNNIVVQVVENDPVGTTAGSASVEFGAGNDDSDHTNASSYCTDSEMIGSLGNFLDCDAVDDGYTCMVDMSGVTNLDDTGDNCNAVEIAIVDEAGFAGTIGEDTFVTAIVDISCAAYQDGDPITVILSFYLPAGRSQQEFEDNLAVRYWDGTNWSTVGIIIDSVNWDTMTITFTTTHLTEFAATSSSADAGGGGGDSGTQAASGGNGGGCSIAPTVENMSTGSALINIIIFLLPLIGIKIRRRI